MLKTLVLWFEHMPIPPRPWIPPESAPAAPELVLERFIDANLAFPQMLGMHTVRMGRAAMDLMLDGQLELQTLAESYLSDRQVRVVDERAQTAHKSLQVDVVHSQIDILDYAYEGVVTPTVLRMLYARSKFNILATMASFSLISVCAFPEEHLRRNDEIFFHCSELLKPENRPAAHLLQAVWQTADDKLNGPAIHDAVTALHGSLRGITDQMSRVERREYRDKIIRKVQTSLDDQLAGHLATLLPQATEVLGSEEDALDVIELFPIWTIHQGDDSHLE